MCLVRPGYNPRRMPWRKKKIATAFVLEQRERIQFFRSCGGEGSCELESDSDIDLGIDSDIDSSEAGSEILYFSLAQFPRSVKRQRPPQKGKSLSFSESVGLRQMGQCHFMAVADRLARHAGAK